MTKPIRKRKAPKNETQKIESKSSKNSSNGNQTDKSNKTAQISSSKQSISGSKRSITCFCGVFITFFTILFLTLLTALYDVSFLQHINFDLESSIEDVSIVSYEQIHKMETIHRRANLSLQEFQEVYDGKWPVLITDVMQHWPASNWTTNFFLNSYGEDRITMKAVRGSLDSAESFALPLNLFLSHIKEGKPTSWTYLEDEMFIEQRPQLKNDILTPIYLKEDFFQMFPQEIRPWNAMLLWGTRFSRSSLHIDPYNWTGTNAVFKGLKKWKLYEPGQDQYLYVYPGRTSGFPLNCYKYNSPIDSFNPDFKTYPLFKHAKAIEFDQKPGEMLIIPTGWFHQAFNDDETMAVSSQVMNSGNYEIVIEEILKVNKKLKHKLPSNFQDMTPVEKVSTLMKLMPKDILDRGRKVTAEALNEIDKGAKGKNSH